MVVLGSIDTIFPYVHEVGTPSANCACAMAGPLCADSLTRASYSSGKHAGVDTRSLLRLLEPPRYAEQAHLVEVSLC